MLAVKRMMNDCMAHLGREALYQQQGTVEPQMTRVLLQPADTAYQIGASTMMAPTAQIVVKSTDVPEPEVGDIFTIDAQRYEIVQMPEPDNLRHVWSCLVMQQCA